MKTDSAGAVVERAMRGGDRSETNCGTEWTWTPSWYWYVVATMDSNGARGSGSGSGVIRLREGAPLTV